ncbi:hypothetical protein MicB006_0011 [Micromonospora sp. B006]|nr:hypothetical protein MicB006_0011 [Micromonospora sp. B006]
MVQTALAGGPDVHTGPLPDRLQALENGDGLGTVLLVVLRCHARPLSRTGRAWARGAGSADRTRRRRARTAPGVARHGSCTPGAAVARGSRSARTRGGTMIEGPEAPARRSVSGLSSRSQSYCAEPTKPPLGTLSEAAENAVAGRTAPPATPPTRQRGTAAPPATVSHDRHPTGDRPLPRPGVAAGPGVP